jgi:hypothetical protein
LVRDLLRSSLWVASFTLGVIGSLRPFATWRSWFLSPYFFLKKIKQVNHFPLSVETTRVISTPGFFRVHSANSHSIWLANPELPLDMVWMTFTSSIWNSFFIRLLFPIFRDTVASVFYNRYSSRYFWRTFVSVDNTTIRPQRDQLPYTIAYLHKKSRKNGSG